MSGYKNTGMTQETYQAMLAFAGFHKLPYDHFLYDAWESLTPLVQQKWAECAAAVRDDTRQEPRY
jgi:hypothetical protein